MFPVFLTVSLALVAGSSMYMSVYGLMAVFVNQSEVILCAGLGMEIGKILVVSHLYRSWRTLRGATRVFYSLVVLVLVVLTSIEVVGFLSQSHEYATHDLRTAEISLSTLRNEAAVIREELSLIDTTLAGLPNSHVTRRIEERNKSGYREKQSRLLEIVKQEGSMQTRVIKEQQNAGPIFAVARIMGIKDTDAVAILVLLLVLVLEPLSIGLTVATTAAWMAGKSTQKRNPESVSLDKEFIELTEKHSLTIGQIVQITGRKKPKTCEEWLNGKTITHLEIDGEIVKELGTGGLQNRNCLRCTHPEIYKDYKHLDEEAELFRQRRCCLNCIHFNEQDSTCPEGGFSEIGNPYKTISSEDCSGFTAKGHGEAILSWKKGKLFFDSSWSLRR